MVTKNSTTSDSKATTAAGRSPAITKLRERGMVALTGSVLAVVGLLKAGPMFFEPKNS